MKFVRVAKTEQGHRREMMIPEDTWKVILDKNGFGAVWELLPDMPMIPIQDSEAEVEKGITMAKLFDIAFEKGVILRRGSWYYFGDTKLGQGEKARDLSDDVKQKIYESISG